MALGGKHKRLQRMKKRGMEPGVSRKGRRGV